MADFSKQYCEKYMSGLPGNFDIIEVFNKLKEHSSIDLICEGYGFVSIGKDQEQSEPILLFSFRMAIQEGYWNEPLPENLNIDDYVWINYNKLK